MDLSSPSKEAVGISRGMPAKERSICGTGGGDPSELSFRSISAERFLNPPHLRSDQREPGREPGRELGRGPGSFTVMLGTLRSEGGPSDRIVRLSSPVGVKGRSRENECPGAELSLGPIDAALVLNDLPLEPVGASGVGNETDRIARGASTATVFSKGTE